MNYTITHVCLSLSTVWRKRKVSGKKRFRDNGDFEGSFQDRRPSLNTDYATQQLYHTSLDDPRLRIRRNVAVEGYAGAAAAATAMYVKGKVPSLTNRQNNTTAVAPQTI